MFDSTKPFPEWFRIAFNEYAVREVYGKTNNPRVIEYHSTCTYNAKDDETAWCSAFVNWCMTKAGIEGTNKINARSWLTWGNECSPELGSIVVLWRVSPASWKGHVGFLVKVDASDVWILGGNQSNMVCIQNYPKKRILGFRTI